MFVDILGGLLILFGSLLYNGFIALNCWKIQKGIRNEYQTINVIDPDSLYLFK